MTTAIHAELPEKLVEEAREFVRAGWAADFNQVVTDALRRYLESHSAELAAAFISEDVQWGIHGRE